MSGTHSPVDAGDAGGDLRDLDRVREPRAQVIVFGGDEHLALPREPAPRVRVLDPIEVALEAQAERIGLLVARARARADRTGRARGERGVERGLAALAPLHGRARRTPSAPACARRTSIVVRPA